MPCWGSFLTSIGFSGFMLTLWMSGMNQSKAPILKPYVLQIFWCEFGEWFRSLLRKPDLYWHLWNQIRHFYDAYQCIAMWLDRECDAFQMKISWGVFYGSYYKICYLFWEKIIGILETYWQMELLKTSYILAFCQIFQFHWQYLYYSLVQMKLNKASFM